MISHAYSLGAFPPDDLTELADRLASLGISITTCAPPQVIVPPVAMLRSCGVNVCSGTDGIRDAWSPMGNAAVLPISWMYCRLMGPDGLQAATETAILSANYISARLRDHYPTLSFPVPGTLMVEPTESETLEEIRQVERGEWPQHDNPLKHAPHTAASVMGAEWNRPYSREVGVFPLASLKQSKYWTPIGRVDNVYGDRNPFCNCVPVSDHAD